MRENFHQNDEKWCFSEGFKIDPGAFWESFWSAWASFLKIPSSKNDLHEKFKKLQNSAPKRRKMRKMRCWKWNFLSQRWKTIEGAPGLRMTRRALSRRVNSELGTFWPRLNFHKKGRHFQKMQFWGKDRSCMRNLKVQSFRAPKQKISDINEKDWRNSRDHINPSAREQGDLKTQHEWENFDQSDEKWCFWKGFEIDPGAF